MSQKPENTEHSSAATPDEPSGTEPISDDAPQPNIPSGQQSVEDTLITKPPTYELSQPPQLKMESRWGTMRISDPIKLKIYLPNQDIPLVVEYRGALSLGRGFAEATEPHLDLDEHGAYLYGVSRRHAVIEQDDTTLRVIDLGSTNGTFLNGHKLQPDQPRILRDGDELALGRMVMRVAFG